MNLNCDFSCPKCQSARINIVTTESEIIVDKIEDSALKFVLNEKNDPILGSMRLLLRNVSSYMLCNSCKHRWNEI